MNGPCACGWLRDFRVSGVPVSMLQTSQIMVLPFCGWNIIDHFSLWWSSSVETNHSGYNHVWNTSICLHATIYYVSLFPHFGLLQPHYCNHPEEALCYRLAFSACLSHLMWCSFSVEWPVWPTYRQIPLLPESKKLMSLSYTVITPVLNPIIYSLRNNEVKGTAKRTITWSSCMR